MPMVGEDVLEVPMEAAGRRPERETLDIPEAAARLGIGRTLAFELARSGAFPVPVIQLGRRMVVSTAAVDRLLGAGDQRPPRHYGAG